MDEHLLIKASLLDPSNPKSVEAATTLILKQFNIKPDPSLEMKISRTITTKLKHIKKTLPNSIGRAMIREERVSGNVIQYDYIYNSMGGNSILLSQSEIDAIEGSEKKSIAQISKENKHFVALFDLMCTGLFDASQMYRLFPGKMVFFPVNPEDERANYYAISVKKYLRARGDNRDTYPEINPALEQAFNFFRALMFDDDHSRRYASIYSSIDGEKYAWLASRFEEDKFYRIEDLVDAYNGACPESKIESIHASKPKTKTFLVGTDISLKKKKRISMTTIDQLCKKASSSSSPRDINAQLTDACRGLFMYAYEPCNPRNLRKATPIRTTKLSEIMSREQWKNIDVGPARMSQASRCKYPGRMIMLIRPLNKKQDVDINDIAIFLPRQLYNAYFSKSTHVHMTDALYASSIAFALSHPDANDSEKNWTKRVFSYSSSYSSGTLNDDKNIYDQLKAEAIEHWRSKMIMTDEGSGKVPFRYAQDHLQRIENSLVPHFSNNNNNRRWLSSSSCYSNDNDQLPPSQTIARTLSRTRGVSNLKDRHDFILAVNDTAITVRDHHLRTANFVH